MPTSDEIIYEKSGRVATVTLNRPERMNALTPDMFVELQRIFDDFNSDNRLHVAILTGAGDQAFCAGADLGNEIPTMAEVFGGDHTKRFFSDVFKPIIAAINGHCTAGGLEIVEATDLRIAADRATFGLGEVRWGLVPAGGSHIRLPRQIPWAVAMEILLTGRPIDSQRAYEVGLVNKVVPTVNVMHEAEKLAAMLCTNGIVAMRTAKEAAVRGLGLESSFALESYLCRAVLESNDAKEGMRAFVEKRQPNFTGS